MMKDDGLESVPMSVPQPKVVPEIFNLEDELEALHVASLSGEYNWTFDSILF